MCKEVFYISPFNSELTAAIIGQSPAPAILAGTWGVIGAAFFQNNEVHRGAASAFQQPDTKPRWDAFDTLKTHFCCDVHSLVLAETHSCSSRGKSCSSPHRYGEWTEQAVTCYVAHAILSSFCIGRKYCMCHCMLFQAAFGQKPTNTESLQRALWYQVPVEG